MRAVKSQGNKSTEVALSLVLRSMGIKTWKSNDKNLVGKPDFVMPRRNLAIFVDGCFWHGCKKCYRRPKTARVYWDSKIAKNIARDRKNVRELKGEGWRVIRIWEHQLKFPDKVQVLLERKLKI